MKYFNPIYQTELEISTHKHRHEKIRNRLKREKKDTTTKIERGTGCNDNYKYSNLDWSASFMPEFWEEICQLKFSSTYQENFINKFNEKMFTGIWKVRGLDNEEKMKFLGEKNWDNWNIIDNEWQTPGWYTYKIED